jgi:hypothetical protein
VLIEVFLKILMNIVLRRHILQEQLAYFLKQILNKIIFEFEVKFNGLLVHLLTPYNILLILKLKSFLA